MTPDGIVFLVEFLVFMVKYFYFILDELNNIHRDIHLPVMHSG
jgi:hypothetical protein